MPKKAENNCLHFIKYFSGCHNHTFLCCVNALGYNYYLKHNVCKGYSVSIVKTDKVLKLTNDTTSAVFCVYLLLEVVQFLLQFTHSASKLLFHMLLCLDGIGQLHVLIGLHK